jgi:hypothetical protein
MTGRRGETSRRGFRTPTVLVVDAAGRVVKRAAGVPTPIRRHRRSGRGDQAVDATIIGVSEIGRDVTGSETAGNVVRVDPRTELLTKRRAVDFCRVATALCRHS